MPKINTISTVSVPKLSDKLIGTSVGGSPSNQTNNFTLEQLKTLFEGGSPPASPNLQSVLNAGNTATQSIYLTGTIEAVDLDVLNDASLTNLYLSERLFDRNNFQGTSGQYLTSTGTGVQWSTLTISIPTLQQVLTAGNVSDKDITTTGDIQADAIQGTNITANSNLRVVGTLADSTNSVGTSGQVLSSTVTGTDWVDLPSYSAVSPLIYNNVSKQFSIQQATNTQNGYLSSADWITFDGKQNAGNYITALTGEATASGPGSVSITLNNLAVINKTLTGFTSLSGTVTAADSIITAFGKLQNQINSATSGLSYQGAWNASTNSPTLTSSVGSNGQYYVVDVAGSTNLNGITDWKVGDWAIFNGSSWQKIDNTDSVVSVNGQIGVVVLNSDNIAEGTTNLYYTDTKARNAISSLATGLTYTASTGVFSLTTGYSIPSISNQTDWTTAYNNSIVSAAVTGTTTKTLTLTQQDGGTITANWTEPDLTGFVPYTGATAAVELGYNALTASFVRVDGASPTSGSYLGFKHATSVNTGADGYTSMYTFGSTTIGFKSISGATNKDFSFDMSTITSNVPGGRVYSMPDANGTLALTSDIPSPSLFVPYTGATSNVNLGERGLTTGFLGFDLTPTGTPSTVGTMYWDPAYRTASLVTGTGATTIQIGQEEVVLVHNNTGSALTDGQVVYVTGSTGNLPSVSLADASSETTSAATLGVVTETIANGADGFVTLSGIVNGLNTLAYTEGDILWLSETAGQFTNVKPISPAHLVLIGYVIKRAGGNGSIFVKIQNTQELEESSDVLISAPKLEGQGLFLQTISGTQLWRNRSISDVLGYTPANAADLANYLPLSGGTLTGALNGTSASFSGALTAGTFNQDSPVILSTNNVVNKPSLTIFKNTEVGTENVFLVQSFFGGSGVNNVASIKANGAATFSSSVQGTQGIFQSSQGSILLRSTGTASPYIDFYTNTSSVAATMYGIDGGGFAIGVPSTERMRITSTGNVGIGTASPLTPLHIMTPTGVNFQTAIRFEKAGGYGETNLGNYYTSGSNYGLNIDVAGSTVMVANNLGRVGIGTTNPLFRTDSRDSLIVSNTDPTTSFSSSTAEFYIRGAAAYDFGGTLTLYPSLWRQRLENIGVFSGSSDLVWTMSANGGAYTEYMRLRSQSLEAPAFVPTSTSGGGYNGIALSSTSGGLKFNSTGTVRQEFNSNGHAQFKTDNFYQNTEKKRTIFGNTNIAPSSSITLNFTFAASCYVSICARAGGLAFGGQFNVMTLFGIDTTNATAASSSPTSSPYMQWTVAQVSSTSWNITLTNWGSATARLAYEIEINASNTITN